MFCYPVRIPSSAIEGGGEGGGGAEVCYGAWEAVLEDAGGIDWCDGDGWVVSSYGRWRWWCGSCWVFRDACCTRLCLLTSSSPKPIESSCCGSSHGCRCAGDDGEGDFRHTLGWHARSRAARRLLMFAPVAPRSSAFVGHSEIYFRRRAWRSDAEPIDCGRQQVIFNATDPPPAGDPQSIPRVTGELAA